MLQSNKHLADSYNKRVKLFVDSAKGGPKASTTELEEWGEKRWHNILSHLKSFVNPLNKTHITLISAGEGVSANDALSYFKAATNYLVNNGIKYKVKEAKIGRSYTRYINVPVKEMEKLQRSLISV